MDATPPGPTIDDAPAPPASPPPEASPAVEVKESAKVKPMTREEMRKFELTKGVVASFEAQIADLTAQKDAMRESRDSLKIERGRARTEFVNAKQLNDLHERALKEAQKEFMEAGITIPVGGLDANPRELPGRVRRLARTVKEIGPDRDALRREVARLNGEIRMYLDAMAGKNLDLAELRKEIDAGKQREKALELTAETMQRARDAAEGERDQVLKDKARFEHQLVSARERIHELEEEKATAAKRLQTSAKSEVKAP